MRINFTQHELDEFRKSEVDKKIINFMVQMIETAEIRNRLTKDSVIDWDLFSAYCHEFGSIDPPNQLTVPHSVIDRCLVQAKKKALYINDRNI